MSRVLLPSISDLPIGSLALPPALQVPGVSNRTVKGVWSTEEDEVLKNALEKFPEPICWEELSKLVPGRTAKQCRERWLFRLSPQVSKQPFERWEDELIVTERYRLGNHWTMIAKQLPGRTSCAVKNRWYTVLKARVELRNEYQQAMQPAMFIAPSPPQIIYPQYGLAQYCY